MVVVRVAAHGELHGVGVDHDFFKANDGRRSGPLKATQHRLDAGDQFAGGKRLGDVVVGAEFQAQDAVVFAGARSKKDDGNGGERGVGCAAGGRHPGRRRPEP